METASHKEQEHPKEVVYVKVAVVLAIITGVEITVSYLSMPNWSKVLALVGLSVIKFAAVVAYFMHLKFDNPALRKPFLAGLALALTVYTIVLLSFSLHSTHAPGA
jgi:cytochrome c oxidase subunit 4